MAKKRQTKRRIEQSDQQRLRRESLALQRVEVVLYADSGRDGYISDYLESLPRGEKGEFVKRAVEEKIARETVGEHAAPDNTPILEELAALRRELAKMQRMPAGTTNNPDHAMAEASGGINMSGPRRKTKRAAPAPLPTTDGPVFDEAAARKILLESVLNFGKDAIQ